MQKLLQAFGQFSGHDHTIFINNDQRNYDFMMLYSALIKTGESLAIKIDSFIKSLKPLLSRHRLVK